MAELKKAVGAFGVFSIASGAMISSGIFILPGLAYSIAGPGLYISYLIAGVFGFIGILSMIELATAMPKAGGDYYYINKSFGPLIGSISGLLGWFALSLKSAFAIFGIAEILYISFSFPTLASGLILTLLFVTLNIIGAKEAALFQNILVIVLLLLMTVFISAGIPQIAPERLRLSGEFELKSVILTSGFVFISFGGLLKAANISEEVKNPKRDLPLGMIASIIVVTVLYVVMVVVMTGTLEPEVFAKSLTPVADSAQRILGSFGYGIILIASTLAFFTTANAGIMAASRYPLALSQDHLIPKVLGGVSEKTGTPIGAVVLTGVLIFLSLQLPLEVLVKSASTVILSSYVLTNLAVIIFRESRLANYSPTFKAPLYPWLQILSISLFIFFIADLGLAAIELSLGLLSLGVLTYFVYGRRKSRKDSALMHVMKRIVDRKLLDGSLEDDFREIVLHRDTVDESTLDKLIQEAPFLDVSGSCDFRALLNLLAGSLAEQFTMTEEEVIASYLTRQEESNTAISEFLALPHIVLEGNTPIFLQIVRAKEGIFFSPEQKEVKAVFFLAGTKAARTLHLHTIASIASLISRPNFESAWTAAETEEELRTLLLLNEQTRRG